MNATILQVMAELPWDKILGGGAAGIAVVMCWLFLKHQSEMRKEHNATIEKVTDRFAGTVEQNADKFNQTAQLILQDSKQREERLYNLIEKGKRP